MTITGPKVSMKDIENEFGTAGYFNPNTKKIELSNYYRGGGIVPNISYNQNIPTSGDIDFSDFIGARDGGIYGYTVVPKYSTEYFSLGDAKRTYRILHAFGITQNTRFSFKTDVFIRGDTRDPDTITSTNSQWVQKPRIAIYVGGNAANGTTEPSGVKILEAASDEGSFSEDDGKTVYFNASNSDGTWANAYTNLYVVASMFCEPRGGPDAPQAHWKGKEFRVNFYVG